MFEDIMEAVTQKELVDFLLNVAIVRPVFIWGPPGIGKSSLVREFTVKVGLDCVSMVGSQLAPEDLIGVPQIIDGKSHFCPPSMIARDDAYVLFLDELNASSQEVQKAFYSLILDRRIGNYELHKDSLVIGAGNRAQDRAIVKPMPSALMNRMVHVELRVSHRDWLDWAYKNNIHPLVIEYIQNRPDHLNVPPPKTEEPFSTPRSWHMLSDALHQYGKNLNNKNLAKIAYGCLSTPHAGQFKAFVKLKEEKYKVQDLLKGKESWPRDLKDRDLLYFLSQSVRSQLIKEIPENEKKVSADQKDLVFQAKRLIKELCEINMEMAQMLVSADDNEKQLPQWFLLEIIRDIPRLAAKES